MRQWFSFKSIYGRFATIFLGIWWFMHLLTFGLIMRVMSGSNLIWRQIPSDRPEYVFEILRVRRLTGLIFIGSAVLGTLLILWAVRGIVSPIKAISRASQDIAKGRFDISLQAKGRDEISQLTDDFNQMARSLQGIDMLQKDFVANVSHEFKTPITAISGYAALIRDQELSPGQRSEYAGLIVDEGKRLSFLSSNLLRLSELDSHMVKEQAVTYALDEQLRKSVLLLELQWQQKQINIELDLEQHHITAPEHLLQEVWLNVIGNAIKYSYVGGTIRIKLRHLSEHERGNMRLPATDSPGPGFGLRRLQVRHTDRSTSALDEWLRIEVTDEGIGIADADQPRIFERFFKGKSLPDMEGNGLGLVIAREIIQLCHGQITFRSQVNVGTTFLIDLPASQT